MVYRNAIIKVQTLIKFNCFLGLEGDFLIYIIEGPQSPKTGNLRGTLTCLWIPIDSIRAFLGFVFLDNTFTYKNPIVVRGRVDLVCIDVVIIGITVRGNTID